MLYAISEEMGKAIAASGCSDAKIVVFDDKVEIYLNFNKDADGKKEKKEKPEKPANKKARESYAGKSVAEWAKALGVSERAVKYRLTMNGTPFSKDDAPKKEDKDTVTLA